MRDKGRQKAGGLGRRISSTEQQNRGKQYTERENEHRTREAETIPCQPFSSLYQSSRAPGWALATL